jgi:hypothetical protein
MVTEKAEEKATKNAQMEAEKSEEIDCQMTQMEAKKSEEKATKNAQMEAEKSEEIDKMEAEKSEEIDRQMTIKKLTIRLWISRNQIPDSMKEQIFSCIKQTLEGNKDFDTEKPIHHLCDKDLLKEIKLHLCLPLLRKVSFFFFF